MICKVLKSIIWVIIPLLFISGSASAQWGLYYQGSLETGGRPHDLVVSGNYAFLGDWGAGFTVINITQPRWPQP